MTDDPTLSCTSTREIPTFSYTGSPKKIPFQTAPPRIGQYRDFVQETKCASTTFVSRSAKPRLEDLSNLYSGKTINQTLPERLLI